MTASNAAAGTKALQDVLFAGMVVHLKAIPAVANHLPRPSWKPRVAYGNLKFCTGLAEGGSVWCLTQTASAQHFHMLCPCAQSVLLDMTASNAAAGTKALQDVLFAGMVVHLKAIPAVANHLPHWPHPPSWQCYRASCCS